MPHYRHLFVATAVLAAAACAHTPSQHGIAAGVLAPELTSSGVSASDVAMYTAMSNDQRMTHMVVNDSMEAAMAHVATWRALNPRIRGYAENVKEDQKIALARASVIVNQQGLVLEPAPSDSMPGRLWDMVDTFNSRTRSVEFDRAFIMSQIDFHMRELAELNAMRGIGGNPAIDSYVQASIPMVESHLKSAQHIARDLGYIP